MYSLVSCNIRFDNPKDPYPWLDRKHILAQFISEHTPLVIATQEGRISQIKDLELLLKDYQLLDNHRSWIKDRMYPCLFVKKNIINPLQSDDHWLSKTPEIAGSFDFDSSFPRLMTWARLNLNQRAQNYLVINTHLDHLKSSTRIEQTKILIQEINKIKCDNDKLILMGDFNDEPNSDIYNLIFKSFPHLIDPWINLNRTEESSYHLFKGSISDGKRIDWIFLDNTIEFKDIFLFKEKINNIYLTDHYPLVVTLKS